MVKHVVPDQDMEPMIDMAEHDGSKQESSAAPSVNQSMYEREASSPLGSSSQNHPTSQIMMSESQDHQKFSNDKQRSLYNQSLAGDQDEDSKSMNNMLMNELGTQNDRRSSEYSSSLRIKTLSQKQAKEQEEDVFVPQQF